MSQTKKAEKSETFLGLIHNLYIVSPYFRMFGRR